MKVAVTSTGTSLDSPMDPRFGRARYLAFVETSNGSVQLVDNEAGMNAAQGAGIQTAQTVVDHGACALITGHCGPKAFQALKAAGIDVYVASGGTVEEVIRQHDAGKLQRQVD
jgi:predicted Fe-Mo cluster-binding NifX family protein